MRKLFVFAAAALIGATLIMRLLAPAEPSYAQLIAEQRALDQADALAPLDTLLAALWRLLPLAGAVGLLVYLAALATAHVERTRRRVGLVQPDGAGLLPVPDAALALLSGPALAGFHAAQLAQAQRVPLPHTYSPRIAITTPSQGHAAILPGDVACTSDLAIPTFAQLLDQGQIGNGRPMLLGFDSAGHPLEGSWLDLYSCAVGGLSGSGKSWTAAFLASQAALAGSKLLLLDPHAENPESLTARLAPLAGRFVCAPATTIPMMAEAVKLASGELTRRTDGGRGEPWLVVIDEFSALQRGSLADPLARLVEALSQEGRKLHMFGMVCGQSWTASRAGGTELRDCLASAFLHRLRPAQARYLSGLTADDLPSDLLELPPGSCYLLATSGELQRITIPQMHPADVERVAALLPSDRATMPRLVPSRDAPEPASGKAPGRHGEGTGKADRALPSSASQSAGTPSAEHARVLALFRDGMSVPDIARDVFGLTSNQGRKYIEAREQVETIIRHALGG